MANEKLEVAISEDGSGSNRLIEAVTKLYQKMDKLADSEDKAAKSSKNQGDAASKASVGNSQLANSVDKAKAGFSGLSSALSGVTALLSVSKLISYADTYQGISDKLKLVTTDQKQLNSIIEASYGIAQRNSTGLADTAKLYGNLSSVVKELGKDQKDTAKLTETITQAIALTGPSAEEAKNGLQQFNQGLSAGVLRGDEFNSVVENIPGLAKAIAAGFSASGPITIGQLRALAEEGKITGKALVDALERSAPNVAKLAATSTDSVSKAFTRLENAVLKFVGQANQANGATNLIAKGIDLITNNINIAIPVVGAFVALLAVGALAGAITAIANLASGFTVLTTGISAATAAMLANPLIAAATLAAIAALVLGLKATGMTFTDLAAKVGGYAGEAGRAAVAAASIATASAAASPALASQGQAATGAATAQTALNVAQREGASTSAIVQGSALDLLDAQTKVGKALSQTKVGFDETKTAASEAVPPIKKVAESKTLVADEAEKARKAMEASSGAMKNGSTAAKDFADRLDKLSGSYNAFSEKLESDSEALARNTKRREENQRKITEALDNLKKYYSTTEEVTSATNTASIAISNFGVSLGDASRASVSYGQSLENNIDTLTEFTKAAQAAGVAAANSSASMSLKDTIKSESVSKDGGGFTNWYYSVTYDGKGADLMPGYGGAQAYQDYQRKAQAYLDKLPKGMSIQQALNSLQAYGNINRSIPIRATEGFARGGSFMVGGVGGTDSQSVGFMASPNERVTIETPAQQYARDRIEAAPNSSDNVGRRREQPVTIITNIKTDDVDSFKRNKRQISQDFARKLSRI